MSDTEIKLLFDNPDGSQKQWVGKISTATDRLIVGFGKVGARLQLRNIPKSSFSSINIRLGTELQVRADKKRREGYYDDPSWSPSSQPSQSTPEQPKPIRRESVMAVLEDDDGPDWFF